MLGAYYVYTIFSHTFSASLLCTNKTMKKEHCTNIEPSGGGGGGGGGGGYSRCEFIPGLVLIPIRYLIL